MPFINVKTNVKISPDLCDIIKSELGLAITAIPGKSESWLMVGLKTNINFILKVNLCLVQWLNAVFSETPHITLYQRLRAT